MNNKKRIHLIVLEELQQGFYSWLGNREIQNSEHFYYFDRPKRDKQFWDTVRTLHKKGYLTDSILQTIKKYNQKIHTVEFKTPITMPANKAEEDPISVKGEAYYDKLCYKKEMAETPWYQKVEPILSFVKEGWVGKVIIILFLFLIWWIIRVTVDSVDFTKYKTIRDFILNILK